MDRHFLKRAWIWVTRIKYCRGFGVQSPNDYRFIRYVINEHWPYYKYEKLNKNIPEIDSATRRLCQLYFRIANHCQPELFIDIEPDNHAYTKYVKAGCRKTKAVRLDHIDTLDTKRCVIVARMDAYHTTSKAIEKMMTVAEEGSVIILQGIYDTKEAKQVWKEAVEHERVGVSYDLYYCGLLHCVKRQFKKKYKVNF